MLAGLRNILRTRQIDTVLVTRMVLAYLGVFALIGIVFTGIVYVYYKYLPEQPRYGIVLFLASTDLLLALATRPLRLAIQERLGLLFYGGTHRYREALFNFSSKIGSILNLDELANEMLPIVNKALLVTQVRLMLADEKGDFASQFGYPESKEESGNLLRLGTGNPIVAWLAKENVPLEEGKIDGIGELDELARSERENLTATGLKVLFPIKSRGRLVGILALGSKRSGDPYTYHDLMMIMRVAGQVGPLIENAQLYSQAVALAVTDGLTGLYNHRHFHRSVEQEIARCSRYNTVFSLIMLDIDLFKVYNDTFGHLAGDGILREVGESIRVSVRTADLAFRYGGEEFAIILPETTLENAYTVSERIRHRIEEKTSSGARTVTASLGVACWDSAGVTKEDIIGRADAALYQAKRTGRNKTCRSPEGVQGRDV